MKQTAVEWLQKQLECFGNKHELQMSWATVDELLEQAKEMEKEKIMDAFYKGRQEEQYKNLFNNHVRKSEEQYYKETFKSE
jgi:hypothetical protein